MFITAYPEIKGFNIHLARNPLYKAANKGTEQLMLDTRPANAMVGSGAAGRPGPAPDLLHQLPGLSIQYLESKSRLIVLYIYKIGRAHV